MAKEAHTPGPWEIDGTTVYALDERGHVNRFSASVQGGYVGYWRFSPRSKGERTSDAELEANAHLIAAAPDMKDAIKEVLHFHDSGGHEGDLDEALRLCRAAIAKARGEA